MNIALGTLLLFLLVVPGIAFRKGYIHGNLTKKISKSSAFDEFIWAIIPGVLIQLLAAYTVNRNNWGYKIDFSSLGTILLGNVNASNEYRKIGENLGAILSYNLILIGGAGIFGYLLRCIIRLANLDHLCTFFRFNNEWFYLLKGEFIFFYRHAEAPKRVLRLVWYLIRFPFQKNRPASCTVNAVVKTDAGTYIYTGIIHSFYLTKEGGLESIVLENAIRRKFFEIHPPDDFYEIPTNIVILKHSEIITMSVIPDVIKVEVELDESNANERLEAAKEKLSAAMKSKEDAVSDEKQKKSSLEEKKNAVEDAKIAYEQAKIKIEDREQLKQKKLAIAEAKTALKEAEKAAAEVGKNVKMIEKSEKEAQIEVCLAEAEVKLSEAEELKEELKRLKNHRK